MERTAWTADEEPLVGVVTETSTDGATTDRRAIVDTLESALDGRHSASIAAGETSREVLAADPALVVAVGNASLSALARAGATVPVLPVDTEASFEAARAEQFTNAVRAAFEGDAVERDHPVLAVETDDGFGECALFDVTLVTDEPAKISEYSVRSRGTSVARFRSDGVVVATPIGSCGYANAAGGPLLSTALEAVTVVPVAPFNTQRRHWVLPDDDLSLVVERDEGAVVLCLDDRTLGTIDPGTVASVGVSGSLSILRPSEPSGTRGEW